MVMSPFCLWCSLHGLDRTMLPPHRYSIQGKCFQTEFPSTAQRNVLDARDAGIEADGARKPLFLHHQPQRPKRPRLAGFDLDGDNVASDGDDVVDFLVVLPPFAQPVVQRRLDGAAVAIEKVLPDELLQPYDGCFRDQL